jgi:hypothetical protein
MCLLQNLLIYYTFNDAVETVRHIASIGRLINLVSE